MSERFRKFCRNVLFLAAIFFILLYLLVCLVPFLNPASLWFIAVLGLAFPILFIIVVVSLVVWVIRRSWWVVLPFVALILSWQQIRVAFGMNFFSGSFKEEKELDRIRVLSWNVFRWDEQNREYKGGQSYRDMMMDAVYIQSADVLCLQEFFQPNGAKDFKDNLAKLREMGYTHSYFYPSSSIHNGMYQFGMAILSRFPIIDSAKFSFGDSPHSEGLMYADIKVNAKTYRFFSVHMESARLGRTNYLGGNDGSLPPVSDIFSQLRMAYSYRTMQADLVYQQISSSPYPVVVCGNIGDVPNSYAYFKVSKGLKDAFLEKGKGFGGTFRYIAPTLRLDCILADTALEVEQFEIPDINYSDHYPLVADFSLK